MVGPGLGFLTWLRLPTMHKSRLVIHSYTLSNLDYIQVVSNWNRILKEDEKDLLASSLGISRPSVGKVKEIKAGLWLDTKIIVKTLGQGFSNLAVAMLTVFSKKKRCQGVWDAMNTVKNLIHLIV